MPILDIVVTIVSSLFCIAVGIYFAGIPLRQTLMTDQQNTIQQILSIICFGLVIVLFMVQQQVASWAVIFALCLGMVIGKIPPIHRALLAKFPDAFLPKNDPRRNREHTAKKLSKTDNTRR